MAAPNEKSLKLLQLILREDTDVCTECHGNVLNSEMFHSKCHKCSSTGGARGKIRGSTNSVGVNIRSHPVGTTNSCRKLNPW